MNKQHHALILSFILAASGIGLFTALRGDGSKQGSSLHPAEEPWLAEEERQSRALDRTREALTRRMEARAAVVVDLLAGRLSLLQAAARFRDLNQTAPEIQENLRWQHPDCSDDELCCLQVIGHLESRFLGDPPDLQLGQRLREELSAHRRHGTLQLPR